MTATASNRSQRCWGRRGLLTTAETERWIVYYYCYYHDSSKPTGCRRLTSSCCCSCWMCWCSLAFSRESSVNLALCSICFSLCLSSRISSFAAANAILFVTRFSHLQSQLNGFYNTQQIHSLVSFITARRQCKSVLQVRNLRVAERDGGNYKPWDRLWLCRCWFPPNRSCKVSLQFREVSIRHAEVPIAFRPTFVATDELARTSENAAR